MKRNSSITPTSGGRRHLPPDLEVAHDVALQPPAYPASQRYRVALITAAVFASMAGFLDANVVNSLCRRPPAIWEAVWSPASGA
jgi:hypothetical protein